jgi:small subunit ribosomal protein S3
VGQKVHPKSLRVGLIQDWDSNWFFKNAKDFAKYVKEDHVIRSYIAKSYRHSAISSVRVLRKSNRLIVQIITGRSGVIIGRGGSNLEQLRTNLSQLLHANNISIEVLEVASVDTDAQLISENIAIQLEKRVAFRRAMRQAIQKAMRGNALGIKVMISGRLAGADIARTEWSKEGRIPLHTFKAGIEFGFSEASTMFGLIGIKVWVYRGDGVMGQLTVPNVKVGGGKPQGNQQNEQQGGRRGPGGPGGRSGKPRQPRGGQGGAAQKG